MITIEDSNNEHYYINPSNVVYVKRRDKFWKIILTTGEARIQKSRRSNGDCSCYKKILLTKSTKYEII